MPRHAALAAVTQGLLIGLRTACRFLERFRRPIVAMRPLRYGPQVSRPHEVNLHVAAWISPTFMLS